MQPPLLPFLLLGPVRGKEEIGKHLYSFPGMVAESAPPGLVVYGGMPWSCTM